MVIRYLKIHALYNNLSLLLITQVVDGPGVGDTRLDNQDSIKLIVSEMEQAMLMNPRGYHAFLLVVKFGARFTREDQGTAAFLKKLFGQEFVKQHCILIMTYGDLFERESEENGQTFEQWCNCQQGVFRELLSSVATGWCSLIT